MKLAITALLALLVSCADRNADPLVVKIHTLRDQNMRGAEDPMVGHEKMRRLFGAISMEERRQRLGQYYTVLWNADAATEKEVLFQYLQAGSGSRVKSMRREIAPGTADGKEEFAVIGDDYFENGRVLAWKISLVSGGGTIATEQSYLWE